MEYFQEFLSDDIAGPSQINPPSIVNGFYFEIKPAKLLKLAFEALCDPEFNPSGKGRIDVDKSGCGITVLNPDNVIGRLCLFRNKFTNFQCNKAMFRKMIDLRQISQNLVAANDEDTLTVFHEDGSDEIYFTFGNETPRTFAAKFLENNVDMPVYPDVEIICDAYIPSRDMRPLIEDMVKNGRLQLVSVMITKGSTTIFVGAEGILDFNYETAGVAGARGMTEGQRHHASFYWPYPEVLRRLILLYSVMAVCIVTKPPNRIMLSTILEKHGMLMFIKEANELNINLPE